MPSAGMLWLNGRDVGGPNGFGLTITNGATGLRDLARAWATTASLGRAGETPLGADAQERARTITVPGCFDASTAAQLAANVRAFEAWAGGGKLVEMVTAYDPLAAYYVRLADMVCDPVAGGQFIQPYQTVTLTFVAHTPRAFFRSALPYRLSTARTPIPLGTAVCAPILTAWGFANPLTVTYRKANGEVVATLTVKLNPGANDYVLIDCHEMVIWQSTAGALARAQQLVSSAFLVLDPRHGDPELGLWPTLELSTGLGECVLRPVHRLT